MKAFAAKFCIAAVIVSTTSGCLLSKAVSVPMRVTGAVVSTVPVIGNPTHDVIDGAAAVVDLAPL